MRLSLESMGPPSLRELGLAALLVIATTSFAWTRLQLDKTEFRLMLATYENRRLEVRLHAEEHISREFLSSLRECQARLVKPDRGAAHGH